MTRKDLAYKLYEKNKAFFTLTRTVYCFIRGVFTGSAKPFHYWVKADKKILYLAVPKAATTSIRQTIYQGERKEYTGGSHNRKRTSNYRISVKKRRAAHYIDREYPGYFKFSFVRNPFDRLVSCYEDKGNADADGHTLTFDGTLFNYLKEDKGFLEFARRMSKVPPWLGDKHFVPQSMWLFDRKGECRVDYIGKFENLQQDWLLVMEKCGLPAMPHYNKSKRGNWMDYYDRKTAELVYEYYQEDIRRFGYEDSYRELLDHISSKENQSR